MHSWLLILSSLGWALITNTLRILAIAVAHLWWEFDLTHGWLHDVLGYVLMILGMSLILSFDQFLAAFCSRKIEDPTNEPQNSIPSPPWKFELDLPASIRRLVGWRLAAIALILMSFVGQIIDLGTVMNSGRKGIDFFATNVLIDVDPAVMPNQMGGWILKGHRKEDRDAGADFGERSDVWTYEKDGKQIIVSFDQAFPAGMS